jgi:hypothetical protein
MRDTRTHAARVSLEEIDDFGLVFVIGFIDKRTLARNVLTTEDH